MQNNLALSNLKVLDFTTLLPGPFATMYLADMGAEVLKVSAPSKTDLVLEYGAKDEESGKNAMGMYLNRNKDTISLNLKKEKSVEIVKELVKKYDIVIEQFRPGVMEKLGLSYEELSKVNPALIYCSISSYGNSGKDKFKAGHDLNFLARSGILSLSGSKKDGPSLINAQIGDIAGGAMHALFAILCAVNYRNISGKGQYIDISMMDCIIPMNTFEGADYLLTGVLPERENNDFNGGGIYGIYETKDKEYLTIASLEPKFFTALCEKLGCPELIKNGPTPKDGGRAKQTIKNIIKSEDLSYWLELFKDTDACVQKVNNLRDVFDEDEHIKQRQMVIEIEENKKQIRQMAMPVKFSCTKPRYEHVGKNPGEDNYRILKSLNLTDEEIEFVTK